ncbi:TlpA family protein disulfide reductase [Algoriphagus pacificus]|uniref:TlpA family protein disulfide reductase n=1 Tax=Algoriphagus pacificus TaxID=2811234 RepID=A0ABS3CKD8_9BACT|nr:TlpA disulfide reductase family protein [Algoriphagus pacificus]MBN7817502.1 TlpA family protein disulfide reductase [Algoriphagus pacificus]
MKKILFSCFLVLLCLYGSTLKAQVACSPPGFELVDCPGLPALAGSHRSGVTRSDTFYSVTALDIDGGPGFEVRVESQLVGNEILNQTAASPLGAPRSDVNESAVDCRPKTDDYNKKGFSLVDTAIPAGQGSLGSPADGEASSDTLTIGDQIPSGIEFSEVLNFDDDKLRLDDYLGKYVILEFWAPTCTASIASLPHLDMLKDSYKQDIEIIPVTVFQEKQIQALLQAYPEIEKMELPLVVNAQKLAAYFPHFIIPHVVILDREGKVLAITGIEDLSQEKLDKLLDSGENLFRAKEDRQIEIPIEARLLTETPELKNKNLWFESALTGYIPEVSGSLIQRFEDMNQIRIINMSLLYHYQTAFSGKDLVDYFGWNRIIQEGFEPEELWSDKSGMDYNDWMAEGTHVFGYEIITPKNLDIYQLMREDLKRYFPHIEAKVERRTRKVYALLQQEGRNYPESSGSKKSYSTSQGLKMTNYPLQGFVYHLNAYFLSQSPYPVINLTGIDYPIDLELRVRLSDPESLKNALQKQGFDLILREEQIPVLVLKKISEPKFLAP